VKAVAAWRLGWRLSAPRKRRLSFDDKHYNKHQVDLHMNSIEIEAARKVSEEK
jgi:hypothetical protein